MSAGLKIDAAAFERAAKAIDKQAAENTRQFAQSMASAFENQAKAGAPWVDRRGNARRRLYGEVQASGSRVRVAMGGSAPNYKSKSHYEDYMELLEFGWESQERNFPNLAIVYPTFELIRADFVEQYGKAALNGVRFRINRSRAASRDRSRRWRARQRAK